MTETKPLLLRPNKSRLAEKLLADKRMVRELVNGLGSPLNVLLPDALSGNLSEFREVLSRHGVDSEIYFAHKASRSTAIVRQLARLDLCLDVASSEELRHGLACGFTGTRMEATGPKNREFLKLLVQHGVTINLDSEEELETLLKILQSQNRSGKTRVLLRVSGFRQGNGSGRLLGKDSRFGVPVEKIPSLLIRLEEVYEKVEFLGFSFHLDSVSLEDRLEAIDRCVTLFEEALELGLSPTVLDIGGGFRVSYLKHKEDWDNYVSALKEAVLGTRPSLTWQDAAFGLSVEKGVLRGNLNSYEFYEPRPGAKFLDDLLSAELPSLGGQSLGDFLKSNMIRLWLEPGRAILDQAGITFATVYGTKESGSGKKLVLLNMKRSDLAFLDQEFFQDPIVLYNRDPPASKVPQVGAFFAGNLCLESDLVLRHMTFLKRLPREGEIVAFLNTAAYAMDFSATDSIMQPRARKVAVYQNPDSSSGSLRWTLDENYDPS